MKDPWKQDEAQSGDRVEVYRRKDGGLALMYSCPACGANHFVLVEGTPKADVSDNGERWKWNLDRQKPTIDPSVRVRHPLGEDERKWKTVCHHHLRNGVIETCADQPECPNKKFRLKKID